MRRDKETLLRMNEEEHSDMVNKAKNVGLSVNAFLRFLVKNWGNGFKFEPKEETNQGEQ